MHRQPLHPPGALRMQLRPQSRLPIVRVRQIGYHKMLEQSRWCVYDPDVARTLVQSI